MLQTGLCRVSVREGDIPRYPHAIDGDILQLNMHVKYIFILVRRLPSSLNGMFLTREKLVKCCGFYSYSTFLHLRDWSNTLNLIQILYANSSLKQQFACWQRKVFSRRISPCSFTCLFKRAKHKSALEDTLCRDFEVIVAYLCQRASVIWMIFQKKQV